MFKIGMLAQKANCRVETVRYYEQIELMPPPDRLDSGHRVYGGEHLKRLRSIRRCRDLGFSLDEIRKFLNFVDGQDYTCETVHGFATAHLETVREQIRNLKSMERSLSQLANNCAGNRSPDCPIIDTLFDDV